MTESFDTYVSVFGLTRLCLPHNVYSIPVLNLFFFFFKDMTQSEVVVCFLGGWGGGGGGWGGPFATKSVLSASFRSSLF